MSVGMGVVCGEGENTDLVVVALERTDVWVRPSWDCSKAIFPCRTELSIASPHFGPSLAILEGPPQKLRMERHLALVAMHVPETTPHKRKE